MTPQQKIDAIYDLLQKREKRERRWLYVRIGYRIFLVLIPIIMLLWPQIFFSAMATIFRPVITKVVNQVVESQKNMVTERANAISEGLKNFIYEK